MRSCKETKTYLRESVHRSNLNAALQASVARKLVSVEWAVGSCTVQASVTCPVYQTGTGFPKMDTFHSRPIVTVMGDGICKSKQWNWSQI